MTGAAALEARLKILEDKQEIAQLLAMHPLAIDSGDGDFWMSNWTKDSVMDRTLDPEAHSGHYEGVYGWDTMLKEIKGPELAASRKAGLMHLNTPPSIKLDGDKATATNYTELIMAEGKGLRIQVVLANRWELVRQNGRWMIGKRTMREMSHEESFSLMQGGLAKGD